MQPVLKPWQKISWPPEHIRSIYRDWGHFLQNHDRTDVALIYNNKALELSGDLDASAFRQRGSCKRYLAQTESALVDARRAAEVFKHSAPLDLDICDTNYELNKFESTKMCLFNKRRKYIGSQLSGFKYRIDMLEDTFNDTLGPNLGPFILHNEKIFPTVMTELARKRYVDPRPRWKILKEQEKCDQLSIPDLEELLLSPREFAKRSLSKRIFMQIYFNKAWKDVSFIQRLMENPNLVLPQARFGSTSLLRDLLDEKYGMIGKFLKMLQARSPLYNEEMKRFAQKYTNELFHEAHLYRVQYQTRRNMITILRCIKDLRRRGNVERLARYVEKVMGDYVALKTYRVMPWKFEFTNEVYNTLALSYVDMCTRHKPQILKSLSDDGGSILSNLNDVLRLPQEKYKEYQLIFGDKSTYLEPDAPDPEFQAYKKILNRLEKRMVFAKYSIEKCYLYYTMASNHLKHNRYHECTVVARKGTAESKNCKSLLWQFLCMMLVIKAHAARHRIERCKEELAEASAIAVRLRNPNTIAFVKLCRDLVEDSIISKRHTKSRENVRRRRSKTSYGSDSHTLNESLSSLSLKSRTYHTAGIHNKK